MSDPRDATDRRALLQRNRGAVVAGRVFGISSGGLDEHRRSLEIVASCNNVAYNSRSIEGGNSPKHGLNSNSKPPRRARAVVANIVAAQIELL